MPGGQHRPSVSSQSSLGSSGSRSADGSPTKSSHRLKEKPGPAPTVDLVDRFHFEENRKGNKRPYTEQGWEEYDLPRLRAKREKIRKSVKVRNAAMQFWTLAGKAPMDLMSFEEYLQLHARISRALAPELTTEEMRQAAEEDWAEDTGHGETCCLEQLTHGLTGIADMWTDSVEELDYTVRTISLSLCTRCSPIPCTRCSPQLTGVPEPTGVPQQAVPPHHYTAPATIARETPEHEAQPGGRQRRWLGCSPRSRSPTDGPSHAAVSRHGGHPSASRGAAWAEGCTNRTSADACAAINGAAGAADCAATHLRTARAAHRTTADACDTFDGAAGAANCSGDATHHRVANS